MRISSRCVQIIRMPIDLKLKCPVVVGWRNVQLQPTSCLYHIPGVLPVTSLNRSFHFSLFPNPTSQILDVRRVVCPEQISFREFYAHATIHSLHFAMSDPTLSQTDQPRDEKPKLMFTIMFQGRSKSSLFMIQCRSKTDFGGVTRHKVCTEASVHSSEIAG